VLPDEFQMDHIVALVNGGRDVESNCQVLCHPCHEVKTREDLALAGRGGVKAY
jgi:5-methylcytosine-specific restriction endonuclease McrA